MDPKDDEKSFLSNPSPSAVWGPWKPRSGKEHLVPLTKACRAWGAVLFTWIFHSLPTNSDDLSSSPLAAL